MTFDLDKLEVYVKEAGTYWNHFYNPPSPAYVLELIAEIRRLQELAERPDRNPGARHGQS